MTQLLLKIQVHLANEGTTTITGTLNIVDIENNNDFFQAGDPELGSINIETNGDYTFTLGSDL